MLLLQVLSSPTWENLEDKLQTEMDAANALRWLPSRAEPGFKRCFPAASYAGLHGAKISLAKRSKQIGRAPPKSRALRCAPVGSIQKLGREDWRADERSLYAVIAEESAQDSQYLMSLSI